MADESTKKVLLNVEIASNEAVKNIAELKSQVDGLKAKQKELDRTTAEGKEQYVIYENQIKAINNVSREYSKEIQNTIKSQNEQKGSLQELKAQLSLQTAEYNKLSAAQREGAKGQEMQASIKGLSDELKKAEGNVGNFSRNVGDYQNQIQNALGLNKGFLGGLQNISTAAKEGGTSFAKQGVAGVQAFAKSLLSLLANPIVLIIAGITAAVVGLYKAFVATDEGATMLASVFKALGNVIDVLMDRAESLRKLFVSIVTLDFKGMKDNAVEAFGGIGEAITDAAKAGYEYEQQMDRIKDLEAGQLVRNAQLRVQIEDLKTASKDRTKTDEERLEMSQRAMELETELLTREKDIALSKTAAESANLASKIQSLNMTTAQKEAALKRWLELDGQEMQNLMLKDKAFADFYNKNEEAIQSLQKMKADDIALDSNFTRETRRIANENATLRKSLLDAQTAAVKQAAADAAAAEKKRLDEIKKAQDEEIKLMVNIQNLKEANYKKLEDERLTDEVYFSQRTAMLEKDAESEKAIVLKQFEFKKITAEEASIKLIEIENNRVAQLQGLSDKRLGIVISELEYQAQLAASKAQEMLAGKKRTDEELHLAELMRIKSDEDAQIKALDLRLENNKEFQTEYDRQIELVRQKGRTATAIADAAFEEKQRQLKITAKKADLLNELELVKNNLQKTFDLKLKQIELDRQAEIEAAEKTGADVQKINDKYNKIELDAKKQLQLDKAEQVAQGAGVAADIVGELNNVLNALGEREVSDAEKKNKTKAENLDRQLKDGLISQQEHDYEVAKSEYELDKIRDKITREAAIRAKALAIINATINASLAIITSLAQGGVPLAIAAGVMGAAALATIIATPLPAATAAGSPPRFEDFASGTSTSSIAASNDGSKAQAVLNKEAETAQKAYDKAQSDYERAKDKADNAIQSAQDLAERIAQEARDRADKEVQAAWEKSDRAIAEASKRADEISSQAQKALAEALSNLDKAQQAVIDIQAKIDKKAQDKLTAEERERIRLIEESEKEIFDIESKANKDLESVQKDYDKLKEIASTKEMAYAELLLSVDKSGKSAAELQRDADSLSSDYQSRVGSLWYQPAMKAELKRQADEAQKLADQAKKQDEKDKLALDKAQVEADTARENLAIAKQNLDNAQAAQAAAAEAAKYATQAAEERARQAAEAAQRASDEEDAAWARELEAAKQAEKDAAAAVEQSKKEAEQALVDAELAAQKKLDAEIAAEARKEAYDTALDEKRRIANEAAQLKADETARQAQAAADGAARAAALASEAAALAAAAAGWTLTGGVGITVPDVPTLPKLRYNPLDFRNDGGYQSRNSGGDAISRDTIKEAMKEAVSEVRVVATIEDIKRQEQNYMIIEDRANM